MANVFCPERCYQAEVKNIHSGRVSPGSYVGEVGDDPDRGEPFALTRGETGK